MKSRVLLCEDNESVRRMISRVLELAGYTTLPANGVEARADLKPAERPDAVLLDLSMPGEAGWETLERLRSEYPAVPVIGFVMWPAQHERALRSGISGVIRKPLDSAALLQMLGRLLDQSNQPAPA